MASEGTEAEKLYNPVESICRKIQAIHRRKELSDPMQQIIKYQSSSFDYPQTNTRKDLEEVLRKMTAAHVPPPDTPFMGSENDGTFISPPETVLPRTRSICHPSFPGSAARPLSLTSPENMPRPRSQSSQDYVPLVSQIRKALPFSDKAANNYWKESHFSALTLDSTPDQTSEIVIPHDSVGKKWSRNKNGWKLGADDGKEDGTCSINRTCEEEFFTSVFHACDTKCRCSVEIAKIIDYLRQATSQDFEEGDSEELWSMLDAEKKDLHVDLETFHAVMKQWLASWRNKWSSAGGIFREEMNSASDSSLDDPVLEKDSITSGGANIEVSDLIIYVADLNFSKQKLETENRKLKLALETVEGANRQLSGDCTELHLQIRRCSMSRSQRFGEASAAEARINAHQAIVRTNLLKEELEELKNTMNASEEQKTTIVAQNKQLETENWALIHKIRIIQEENTKNIMDMYTLEKNIEQLSKTETEHQMQLHMYEKTLLNKDATLQKKDLNIEELKATIIEYGNIIENLRGGKNKLAYELQYLQQELIMNEIQLNVSGEHKSVISKGDKSLYVLNSFLHRLQRTNYLHVPSLESQRKQ